MLPLRWSEDATPSGGTPQSVVDEQLLEESDLIVAVFKERRGPSRGTEHEIRHFLAHRREKRVMVFFHRDAARDVDLEDLYNELKDQLFYGQYRTPQDLAEQVQDALFERAQKSLAAEPIQKLRLDLARKLREWQTLNRIGTEALEHAFTILDIMHAALLEFDNRRVGLVLGATNRQVQECIGSIHKLVRDQEAFIATAPWDECDRAMLAISTLVGDLPDEDTLI